MLDSNGNSIIQSQAVQSHVSWGHETAQEQVYDWAKEESNLAMIFPLQPQHLFQFICIFQFISSA